MQDKDEKLKKKNLLPHKRTSSGRFLLRVIFTAVFFALLLSLSMGGWIIYQLQQQQLIDQVAAKKYQVYSENFIRKIDKKQNENLNKLALQGDIIDSLESQVSLNAQRLREFSFASKEARLLAEVEHLVRLTNHHLISDKNPVNTVKLLASIAKILKNLEGFGVLGAREAAAQGILALGSIQVIDREDLYTQLGVLSDQLSQMPMPNYKQEFEVNSKDVSPMRQTDEWREKFIDSFSSALSALKNLVRIRRLDIPLSSIPTEVERQHLKYSLAALLEHAQIGLLREEVIIYRGSLQKARGMLVRHYGESSRLILPYIEQLEQLERRDIIQKLPDIFQELEVLRSYIDGQYDAGALKAVKRDLQ